MKQYLQECPLARLEFKPTGTQINTLQCTVCKGAGFHKYLFKNTVDSFTSASLRKAAHHLASKEHQASAEAADSGKSLVMETQPQIFLQTPNSLQSRLLQDAINVLEKDLSHPFHVKNTRSRVVKTYCTYCPTWSFTHRISHEDPATSVTTIKAMAQAHLASSLHIARLKTKIPQAETGFKKPNAQPMTQQITEAQFASVDRASQPRLATNFRGAEQSTSSLAESSPNILRPRLEAAIDEVRDQVSPRSSLYMVPAPSSSKRLEVKCNHCPDWYWAHSATLADVPRNFENTLAAVRMHLQSSHHTRALLLELSTGYSAGNEGKLELSPPISRKNKPSQQLAADTVKRVRSGTHEPQAPSVSTSLPHLLKQD
ncbi:hypothetical protein BKA65DRAFT_38664 [Rhexocercosporidium sp. MPI-PUGE-AT-0058]|nr:hypothetical protein BKA65DRAFT_38664 [Rhexocercosporidium sp. MPI-PUGE-AT-0058]